MNASKTRGLFDLAPRNAMLYRSCTQKSLTNATHRDTLKYLHSQMVAKRDSSTVPSSGVVGNKILHQENVVKYDVLAIIHSEITAERKYSEVLAFTIWRKMFTFEIVHLKIIPKLVYSNILCS